MEKQNVYDNLIDKICGFYKNLNEFEKEEKQKRQVVLDEVSKYVEIGNDPYKRLVEFRKKLAGISNKDWEKIKKAVSDKPYYKGINNLRNDGIKEKNEEWDINIAKRMISDITYRIDELVRKIEETKKDKDKLNKYEKKIIKMSKTKQYEYLSSFMKSAYIIDNALAQIEEEVEKQELAFKGRSI